MNVRVQIKKIELIRIYLIVIVNKMFKNIRMASCVYDSFIEAKNCKTFM